MNNEKEEPLYEFNLPEDPSNPRYIASRQIQPTKKKQKEQGTSRSTSNHNTSS